MKKITDRIKKIITIKELLKTNMPVKEIAARLNTSTQMIYKWKKKEFSLIPIPRKKKLKKSHIKMIKNLAEDI